MTMVEQALRHTIDAAKRRIAELEAERDKYKADGQVAWAAYEQLREWMKGKVNEH